MTDVGCPKCGVVISTAPPNSTHTSFTTENPGESNNTKYIERPVKCPDSNNSTGRRMIHEFKIYWYKKDS